MRNRAVVLTYLNAPDRAADMRSRCRVAGPGQGIGDPPGTLLDGCGVDHVPIAGGDRRDVSQDRVDASTGKDPNGLVTADLTQLAHRCRRQIVVGVLELRPARGSEAIPLRGPPSAGVLPSGGGIGHSITGVDQNVEVPAHPGRGDAQPLSDLGRGDRSRLEQQLDDRPAGLTVVRRLTYDSRRGHRVRSGRYFHNTSVTQLIERVHQGCPQQPIGGLTDRYSSLVAARQRSSGTSIGTLRSSIGSLSSSIAQLHGDERTGSPLNEAELAAMRRTRLFGATGTVLMGIGALGAGARPVIQDPTFGVRLLNLPSRIQTVSLTMTTTGAVMMALAWLMLGRFALGGHRMSRSQLDHTLMLWMMPLLIAPPMYSKDVYSYLAQSQISRIGLNPYKVGPAPGLGLDHVFTLSVPSLWRETPAPYGPLFLWIGRGISALTGENIVAAVLCHRLIVLIGVGLIVWSLPRLAHRCGVAEVSALWLGAANPLLVMHLVAGIHNEALMLGLMLTGTEFALRGVEHAGALVPHPVRWPRTRGQWAQWVPLGMLFGGATLITLSSQVKLPGLLALGFVAMALACRWGGTFKAFLGASALMGGLALAVMALIGWASGLGFGWLFTLGTANVVRSWMSPPTLLALGTGQVGILLGLGDHTTAVLSLTRAMGVLVIAITVTWLLLAVLRGRLHPVGGLGVALGATVLLFPVVQPWYLLWAIIPLAAWATRPGFRRAAIAVSLVVGIFGPTANGDRFALFQIVDATVASTVIVVLLIALTFNRLPWRGLPNGGDPRGGNLSSSEPRASSPSAGAYADSP